MKKHYYILFYEYGPDYMERRGEFRRHHMELASGYVQEGKLLLGGAFANPADGAVLVFYVESREEVEQFVKIDPYVQSGLVTSHRIRDYTVVVGSACENPIDIGTL